MIDPKLLELIRCPVDGQSLVQANNAAVAALNDCIARGEIRDASDGLVQEPIEGALVTLHRTRAYAIRGGIPTLIPSEAMEVPAAMRMLLDVTGDQS